MGVDPITLIPPKREWWFCLRALPDIRNARLPGIITPHLWDVQSFTRYPGCVQSPANPAVLESDPGKRSLATYLRQILAVLQVSSCTSGRRLSSAVRCNKMFNQAESIGPKERM